MRLLAILSPTNKWGTKTEYTKLRKNLIKDGYIRIAPEVYMRIVQNRKAAEKYYQRIVKNSDSRYLEWIDEMKNEKDNKVYIYGHSLGETDGDVLTEFILADNCETTIFYYNEFDRAEKIKNLAIILKPNNLIRMMSGSNPKLVLMCAK